MNFRTEHDAAEARRELNGIVIAGNSKRPMRIEFKVIGGFGGTASPSVVKVSPQMASTPTSTEKKKQPSSSAGKRR